MVARPHNDCVPRRSGRAARRAGRAGPWWPAAKHHQRHAWRRLSKLLSRRPVDLLCVRSRKGRVAHLEDAGSGRRTRPGDEQRRFDRHRIVRPDLFYVDNVNGPGSVWRLPQGGGPAVKVVEGVVLGNFDVVDGGLYYIDRVSGERAPSATGPMARPGCGTSISPRRGRRRWRRIWAR